MYGCPGTVPEVVADDGADRPPGPIDLLLHALAVYRELAQFVGPIGLPHDLGFGGFGLEPPVVEIGLVGEDVGTFAVVAIPPGAERRLRRRNRDQGGSFTDTVDTTAATVAVDEPTDCEGLALLPTRSGINFTPAEAGLYEFSTAGSSYSAVGIYTGSRGLLTQVSCFW